MANEIKVGSVVELKSNSIHEMTVNRISGNEAEVLWFDRNVLLQKQLVPLAVLKLSISDPEHDDNQDVDDGTTAV